MPFAPVKSDPWKRGLSKPRSFRLWPDKFHAELVKVAKEDEAACYCGWPEKCLKMIGDINERMYGKR